MKFIFKYNERSELYLYWTSLKQRWFSIYSTYIQALLQRLRIILVFFLKKQKNLKVQNLRQAGWPTQWYQTGRCSLPTFTTVLHNALEKGFSTTTGSSGIIRPGKKIKMFLVTARITFSRRIASFFYLFLNEKIFNNFKKRWTS